MRFNAIKQAEDPAREAYSQVFGIILGFLFLPAKSTDNTRYKIRAIMHQAERERCGILACAGRDMAYLLKDKDPPFYQEIQDMEDKIVRMIHSF